MSSPIALNYRPADVLDAFTLRGDDEIALAARRQGGGLVRIERTLRRVAGALGAQLARRKRGFDPRQKAEPAGAPRPLPPAWPLRRIRNPSVAVPDEIAPVKPRVAHTISHFTLLPVVAPPHSALS